MLETSSGQRFEGVSTNIQKGREGLYGTMPDSYSPHLLVSQSAMLQGKCVQDRIRTERKTYCALDDQRVK